MSRILVTIVLGIGAGVLIGFYVRPEWAHFNSLGQEIAELEEISREFDELIASRDSLLERVNSISKEDIDRLNRVLPQGAQASDFLVTLESLALESGAALRRIDITGLAGETKPSTQVSTQLPSQPRPVSGTAASGSKKESEKAEDFPFTLQVAGPYPAFKEFLARLEKNMRLIDVENISFASGGIKGEGEALEFSIKAKTYYQ